MLTCIACTKRKLNTAGSSSEPPADGGNAATPSTKQAVKSLTAQIKDMAVKASGAYKNCKPCSGSSRRGFIKPDSGSVSERFHGSYRRAGSIKDWEKEMETKLHPLSSGSGTPASVSGRTESVLFMEEDDVKEWVAQVEPGVLITFDSLPKGGNDLKRIRFSRDIFNKWQAQQWWAENYDRIIELYNVKRFNSQTAPLQSSTHSEDESSKANSDEESLAMPASSRECAPHHFHHSFASFNDSVQHHSQQTRHHSNSGITTTKAETSSLDGSLRSSSSREIDHSEDLSMSNASDLETTEWVEQDDPGVYITLRALPSGVRELRRVRFSRERFGEAQARLWWEENRGRIQQQYL